MPEFLKYLGGKLRSTYDMVVAKPLPWSMIDKLETLEERAGQRTGDDAAIPDPATPDSNRSSSEPGSDDNAKA